MKNLETEYKSLANSDLPDLWSRIESALPEKTNNVNDNVVPFAAASDVADKAPMDSVNAVRRKRNFRKYIGIVAAIIVCLVGLPVFLSMTNKTNRHFGTASTAASTCADFSADCDTYEEAAGNSARGISKYEDEAAACEEAATYEEAAACDEADYSYEADDYTEAAMLDSDAACAADSAPSTSDGTQGFSDSFIGGSGSEDVNSVDGEEDEEDESVSDNSVSENSISENAAGEDENANPGGKEGAKNE